AIGGAAFKDMISVAERRFPIVELVIASSKVQGEGAADEIANNINLLNKRDDIDLIIIGRGGGSLEDLWAFNEEVVAREIFESKIPIISGVGHEIDFTIADFAADLRAPTPTAAMELATPSRDEIFAFITDFSYTSTNNIFSIIDSYSSQVNQVLSSYGFRIHDEYLRNRSQYLDNIWYKIQMGIENSLTQLQNKLALTHNSIEAFNLDKILKKGFAIVKQNEKYVTRGKDFKQNEKTKIKFYDKQITIN
ncbi:MAG: exodeoxyribonuclease VII large subunit, partial [Melioribacteraceae bacterium]|nr:exodeoxyribonuclease VII large subunit [Melioribacteraceae bacterium]